MIIDAVELKRRYQLRIAGVRDKKVYIGPEVVVLTVNNSCNLTCRYCWIHAPGSPAHFYKPDHSPLRKFIEIIHDSVDLNVDQIHIVGSGEPTMYPAFRDMMRHLEYQPVYVKLLTNGTFPLEYCSDVIKGDHIIINLSAADRQRYHNLQGKDLFDRVVANISRLVYLRDTKKPTFHIEINYIVNTMNIDQEQQMRELASQLGVNSLYFEEMNVHEYNRDIALPESSTSKLGGEKRRTPSKCLNGWFYIIIRSGNGSSICCRIHKIHLGDLDKGSLKELWFSPHMMNVRLLGKYGHIPKTYKECQTCLFYKKNMKRIGDVSLLNNDKALTK